MTEPTDPFSEPSGDVAARSRSRDVRMVVTGVVAVLLIWFAVANLQDVKIHFWVTTTTAPLIGVIVIAGGLGGAIASLVLLRRRRPRRGTGPEE
jgi:uncharacterized integral membrane protein